MEVKNFLNVLKKNIILKSYLLDKKVNRITIKIKKNFNLDNLEKEDKNKLNKKNEIEHSQKIFFISQIKYLFLIINLINNERKRFREIIQNYYLKKKKKENLCENKKKSAYFMKDKFFKMHEDLKNSINSIKIDLDDFKKKNNSIFLNKSKSSLKSKKFNSFFKNSKKDNLEKKEKKIKMNIILKKKKEQNIEDTLLSNKNEICKNSKNIQKRENSLINNICYKSRVKKRKINTRQKKKISN